MDRPTLNFTEETIKKVVDELKDKQAILGGELNYVSDIVNVPGNMLVNEFCTRLNEVINQEVLEFKKNLKTRYSIFTVNLSTIMKLLNVEVVANRLEQDLQLTSISSIIPNIATQVFLDHGNGNRERTCEVIHINKRDEHTPKINIYKNISILERLTGNIDYKTYLRCYNGYCRLVQNDKGVLTILLDTNEEDIVELKESIKNKDKKKQDNKYKYSYKPFSLEDSLKDGMWWDTGTSPA